MQRTTQTSPRRRIAMYLSVTAILTAVAIAFTQSLSPQFRGLIVMWCPGVAALLTSLFTRRRLGEMGWRPGSVRFLLLGWLLPIVSAGLVYGTVWLTGLGDMPSPLFLERATRTLGLHGQFSAMEIVLRAFAYISVMGLMNPGALGEELGWRGFLVPELNRVMDVRRAALLSGFIWAVWHWPSMLLGGYHASTPLAYQFVCFTMTVTAGGVLYAWLRSKSGSVWPGYVMHAAHNAIVQMFFDRVTINKDLTPYFTTEFGIGMVIVSTLIAAWCWRHFDEVRRDTTVTTMPLLPHAA